MKKLTLVFLTMLILAACAAPESVPTPTPVNIEALQTQAVKTVMAEITQTAAAFTVTPSPTKIPASPTPTEATPTVAVIASPTSDLTPTPNICDNAVFVTDVTFPDGTQVEAGKSFQKTWKFKNTGSCRWTRAYTMRFAYGEAMNARVVYLENIVEPGEEADISVVLTAPTKPGTYRGYWRLFSNNGYSFGEYVSVVIVVP